MEMEGEEEEMMAKAQEDKYKEREEINRKA